jgi:hypothetical protein
MSGILLNELLKIAQFLDPRFVRSAAKNDDGSIVSTLSAQYLRLFGENSNASDNSNQVNLSHVPVENLDRLLNADIHNLSNSSNESTGNENSVEIKINVNFKLLYLINCLTTRHTIYGKNRK